MYINLEKAKEEFLNYTKNYDLNDKNIDRKVWHSIRVMELSLDIAKKMNLNEEDIEIAGAIGLLHDLGRFDQFTKYQTFSDLDSFDHGDYAVELLNKDIRKYIETDKYDTIIKKAIKNHNKFEIEEGLNERELFFAKLIRDADKLDILYEASCIFWAGEEYKVNESDFNSELLNIFFNKQLTKHKKNVKYIGIDAVIIMFTLIFDINFKESFEILKNEDYINKTSDRFNIKDKETLLKVREFAINYINDSII